MTATDTYDANGNTTASGSTGYVYDFENHLISANGITYVYDGDGHRVSKTVNGVTTSYATTDINPTGYSQVVGESYSPRVNGTESQHSYIYGLDAALELRRLFRKCVYDREADEDVVAWQSLNPCLQRGDPSPI